MCTEGCLQIKVKGDAKLVANIDNCAVKRKRLRAASILNTMNAYIMNALNVPNSLWWVYVSKWVRSHRNDWMRMRMRKHSSGCQSHRGRLTVVRPAFTSSIVTTRLIYHNVFNTLALWSLVLVVLFTFYCGPLQNALLVFIVVLHT